LSGNRVYANEYYNTYNGCGYATEYEYSYGYGFDYGCGYYDMPVYGPVYDPDPTEPEAPDEPDEPVVHTMQYQINSGDTLYQIARNFGISTDLLLAANDNVNPKLLKIGQMLNIPTLEAGLSIPDVGKPAINKILTTTLTAYTAGIESTGKTPSHPAYGITYSGYQAMEGRTIAVDPSIIPLGTTVYIDGIGVRTAEDTGSAIRGSRIDVFMDDVGEARQFGVKKNVKVYVLGERV
jgi:3D (Asp-Asp-Asp) domain-containing protein